MSGNGSDDPRARMARQAASSTPRGPNPFTSDDPPFTPLGLLPGTGLAFLDSHNMLQLTIAKELSRNNLVRWCNARPLWLVKTFPRPRKGQNSDEAETFKPEQAADRISNACAFEGPWEPKSKLRGRGAWLGDDDDLVLHCGDVLWLKGHTASVGRRGDLVYPSAPPIMRPAKEPQPAKYGPGDVLWGLLHSWQWQRPELDTLLLLGWIGSGLVGGALPVRPAVWLTGPKGAGKSTLTLLIQAVYGQGSSCITSVNTTAAGVWQELGYDCIPVLLDEAEKEVENKTVNQLVKIMRTSYSGGDVQRGSSEGTAHQYPVRSSFLFSSINVVSMKAQDRSRCATLEMLLMKPGTPLAFALSEMPALGRGLLRRLADNWQRLLTDAIPAWHDALIDRGWDGRGADTYGTLLAVADVLLTDRCEPESYLEKIGADLDAARAAARVEEAPDYEFAVYHLRGAFADPWRGGERRPIGELVREAAGLGLVRADNQQSLDLATAPVPDEEAAIYRATHDDGALDAQRTLMAYGLKIVLQKDEFTGRRRRYVAIANQSAALNGIFAGTHWSGQSGTSGGWRSVLARAPGAQSGLPMWFRDGKHRATLVPLDLFLDLELPAPPPEEEPEPVPEMVP